MIIIAGFTDIEIYGERYLRSVLYLTSVFITLDGIIDGILEMCTTWF